MSKIIYHIVIATLLLLSSARAKAQEAEVRPVLSAFTVGMGSSHLCDTYLSPLKYQGWSLGARYERMQAMKASPRKWVTQLNFSASLDRTLNPAGNAVMWGLEFSASWGTLYRYQLPKGFTIAVGPAVRAEGGCLYNARNSNNPASAKGAITIDATAFACWNTRLGRLPITLRYQPTLPVIGAFFSPRYDELYFEIYMGNHSGLVHPAWWGNRFKLDQLLTLDLHLGSSSLRLGYESSWMSSRVSAITTRIITHRFVIGWTSEWLSISRNQKSVDDKARIISALY